MHRDELLERFLGSRDTLWVQKGTKLVFRSEKGQLVPLVEYIQAFVPRIRGVIVFDRVVGNAAALLLKKALCLKVYSPIASRAAVYTLQKLGIGYHFWKIAPCIMQGNSICPMEEMSLGKSPDEFYEAVKGLMLGEAGAE